MYQPYLDILDKMGAPLWWDENGVPRYVPFKPEHCADIYNKLAALMLIRCQGCQRELPVASTWGLTYPFKDVEWDETGKIASPKSGFPKLRDGGFLIYGDAPWHDYDGGFKGQCSGTTMSTAIVRVVEFWDRRGMDDKRAPEYEVYVGEDESW